MLKKKTDKDKYKKLLDDIAKREEEQERTIEKDAETEDFEVVI